MRSVRVNGWGQPLVLEEIPEPGPASDEVLVRVRAASLNPFDSFLHAGYMQGYVNLPLTLGTDFAGDVVEVGSEVSHVKAGDAVYGLTPMHSGTFADYVVAKANEVTHKPGTLDYIEAAGVPLAGLAGYQSLLDLGQAKKGDRILIIGAGGSAGATALQIAKELGAVVYAVDIPEKTDFVKALGPDRFIDAKTEKYEDLVGPVDLVLDFVSGDNFQRSTSILKDGGIYVTTLFVPEVPEDIKQRGIQTAGLATQPKVEQLDDLAQRIDSGRLKLFINSTFPLEEVEAAIQYRMTTTKPGKIVLVVS